jgi:hypothetical protein
MKLPKSTKQLINEVYADPTPTFTDVKASREEYFKMRSFLDRVTIL